MIYFRYLVVVLFLSFTNLSYAENKDLQIKITKNLRCLICQGQSVYDSDSEFANSLKALINDKLEEGNNEEQIYDYLKDKYGEWILYDPTFNKNTYILWLLPILMFVLGGAIISKLFIIKKIKYILIMKLNFLFNRIFFIWSIIKSR